MDNKKTVIITGGGKGIGFGIAKVFAKENYNIVITGRTSETLEKAKKELENKYNINVSLFVAEGSSEDEVINVVNSTISKYGRIDCLINNAQASKSGILLKDHSKADFDLAINSGLYATFYYMRECYNYLKETSGTVINFASGAGISGNVGQASYAASKEGIRGLSRVAATEWALDKITVNVICPLVLTEQLESWKDAYPDLYNKTIQSIPMGRFGEAKEVGELCVFLASDKASYITGQTISLQGGLGLRP